jgi:hypothetical protein
MISIARLYVPIDGIVTGRYFPSREPLPMIMGRAALEFLRGFAECLRRLLVPIEMLGLMLPECLGIREGVVLDLVLWMGRHAV